MKNGQEKLSSIWSQDFIAKENLESTKSMKVADADDAHIDKEKCKSHHHHKLHRRRLRG